MKKLSSARKFPFPYVLDETQNVAKAYGAVCTPDFFGFDKDMKLQYRGRVDELLAAMAEVAKTRTFSGKQFNSMGCNIKWVAKKKNAGAAAAALFYYFSGICLAAASFLILSAFRDNITLFRTPTDLITKPVRVAEQIRVGGLVKEGSFKQNADGSFEFVITDNANDLSVKYSGVLPSLFREKQGVIAYGALNPDKTFTAKEILAKHDEKYMPPEVYKELKERGYFLRK